MNSLFFIFPGLTPPERRRRCAVLPYGWIASGPWFPASGLSFFPLLQRLADGIKEE